MKQLKNRAGFTLVEIMIVVAIIALLAAIALPNFLRARKRSQATTVINDLRQIDQAMDQYSVDTAKVSGFNPSWADIQNYLKTDTNLYSTGNDLFGDSYGPFTVDSITQVPTSAFNTLSDVADASFWGQYYGATGGGSGSGGSNNPTTVWATMDAANYQLFQLNNTLQAAIDANYNNPTPTGDAAVAAAQAAYNTQLTVYQNDIQAYSNLTGGLTPPAGYVSPYQY